jgi:hypothetical protein
MTIPQIALALQSGDVMNFVSTIPKAADWKKSPHSSRAADAHQRYDIPVACERCLSVVVSILVPVRAYRLDLARRIFIP